MASCYSIVRRCLSTSSVRYNVFNHVTVIGGGLMGSGIAQVTAQSGMDVTIIEVNEEAVKKTNANITNSIQRVAKKLFQNQSADAEKYISESMGRLKLSTDLDETISKTDLVVEAIVENLDAKHKLFSKIDSIAPEHTIFASNTSSIPIGEIAAVTNRKDRFGGLHFFNPVPVMKLLEVIKTEDTSEDTYQKMMSWGKAIGKSTVTCKDTPGFVVNRLLVPYLAEAARMLQRGDATAKDIDTAMKLGAGYPMGPLELLDYVGLDTTKFILDGWYKKYPNNPLFAPVDIVNKLVAEGKLGKKTGEGFYNYKKSIVASNFELHAPYFQPLPLPPSASSSLSSHSLPEVGKDHLKGGFNKARFEKSEMSRRADGYQQMAKLERQEKLKKLDRRKNLEKWKTPDESAKFEKEQLAFKKLQQIKRLRFDHSAIRDMCKNSDKSQNLEDYIKFEREKCFQIPPGIH